MRDGRLVGGILMGDISKAAYLMQAFDRDSTLPEERLSLLFDLGAPSAKGDARRDAGRNAGVQLQRCDQGRDRRLRRRAASAPRTAVMEATRAGMGCGSCKSLVNELVDWFCGGTAEEDPSIHYYVPSIPLTKPELVNAIREQGLKSVSAVFMALGAVASRMRRPNRRWPRC